MDNKTVFVRTVKGEDEMENRASRLSVDVKRALLMVDERSTFGEIYKRAAPSMRASLGEMFLELEKGGFIQDKALGEKTHRTSELPKMSIPPHMIVPSKVATPPKQQPVAENADELDFVSGYSASLPAVPTPEEVNAEKLRLEAEEKAKREIETEKIRAQREAEAILHKAEQEAARIREETVRRAQEAAESARLKAELQAKKMREEIEASRLNAEHEAKLRLEAAAKERQRAEAARLAAEQEAKRIRDELEAARLKAEQEAKRIRDELEAARLKAEQEAKLRLEVAARERQQAEAARVKAEQEAKARLEVAARERQQAEAARVKAEQEVQKRLEAADRERQQAEVARIKAEQEVQERLEAAARERQQAEVVRIKAEQEAQERLEAAAKVQARINAEEQAAAQEREAAIVHATRTTDTVPTGKPDVFAFEAFDVDGPQGMVEPDKDQQSARESSPTEDVSPAKAKIFAFDLFDVEQPPTEQATPASQPSEAANTVQAEDIQQPVQPQVTTPAVIEPSGSESSEEQIKRQEQERIAAEAQAKELASAQAKIWAEAEQRALEVAKASMERAVQQAERPDDEYKEIEKLIPSLRAKRRPFSWGRLIGLAFKLGVLLLVLLIGVLFAAPYVLPMRDYMPKVQQLMSARLQQPVHLGHLSARLLPTPRLELGEIYIGDAKQFQAEQAYLDFSMAGLFGNIKPIDSVDFQGVKVKGASLQNASLWLQQLATDSQYPVAHMVISKGVLDADVFEISGIEGDLNFDPAGKFTKANLRANAGKYLMDLKATPENKLQVAISVRDSTLPLLPNWLFDDLSAKGTLNSDGLQISDFDARMLGGVVQGSATINWRSGWSAQGDLNAKTITLQKLDKLLDGNAEGSARFKMAAVNLAGLADSVMLDGSFISRDGVISGLDIVETARLQSKENLPGGRTHFDTLSGVIAYANNAYHFKQVKIVASSLNAMTTFDVTKQQQLSGKMNVRLSLQDETTTVELKLGGAVDNPTLRYEP